MIRADHHVLLLSPIEGAGLCNLCGILEAHARVDVVANTSELAAAPLGPTTTLIAYGTGVIVPSRVLRRLQRTPYNFHAASPEFPGRDPHHFAIYHRAEHYGATAHVLTDKVDAGPIIDVEWFDVPPGCTPRRLLGLANARMRVLFERLAPAMATGERLPILESVTWAEIKMARADFLAMCETDSLIDEEEFERRYRAFDGEGHDNLVLVLHGRRFRIDKSSPPLSLAALSDWDDFTEDAYRDLLRLARLRGYEFSGYRERPDHRHVIWRHDVDLSMHRALRLAEIEAEEGVSATYFVNPHCAFYNLVEPTILSLVRKIRELGHAIGLHFDADAYPSEVWSAESLGRRLSGEKRLLELTLETEIAAFSYHNPDVGGFMTYDADMAGMVNAYGRAFREDYTYVSDSNGFWRFRSIEEVLSEGTADRLHVLIHPAWWTPNPMSPRDRVLRAAHGRAAAIMRDYDRGLEAHDRRNVRR